MDVCEFSETLDSSGFLNLITTPTTATDTTETALRLFVTNVETHIISTGTVVADISGHCPVFVIYTNGIVHIENGEPIVFQNVTERALESFEYGILSGDWSSVFSKTNANDAYADFIEKFVRIHSDHFPLMSRTPSQKVRKP